MPRIRALKIGFFQNEDLSEFSFAHRLLFAGLWIIADKAGRLEYRPKRIKAALFPYNRLDIVKMIDDLSRGSDPFLVQYEVEGRRYIAIPNWNKHQRPHHTEAASELPDINGALTVKIPLDDGNKLEGLGKGKELVRQERAPTRGLLCRFDELHKSKIGAPASISKGKDAKILAEIWKQHGDFTYDLMAGFFVMDSEFVQGAGYTVGVFKSQVGKLLTQKARAEGRIAPAKIETKGGKGNASRDAGQRAIQRMIDRGEVKT